MASPPSIPRPATPRRRPPAPTLPIVDDATRSPDPAVCPFFRFELEGDLVAPLLKPDDGNRCVAIDAPRPQSARQQELVCLRAAHADCPRYLKGAMALQDPGSTRTSAVPRATVAALLVLVLSAGISFGFVVQRGGIELPVVAAAPSLVRDRPRADRVARSADRDARADTRAVGGRVRVGRGGRLAKREPEPVAERVAVAIADPVAVTDPVAHARTVGIDGRRPDDRAHRRPDREADAEADEEADRSDRYKLLEPCPNQKNCWIYTVRSGDNLYSIANYFGIPLAVIYDWNPRYAQGARLRQGDEIRMPPPRR